MVRIKCKVCQEDKLKAEHFTKKAKRRRAASALDRIAEGKRGAERKPSSKKKLYPKI
jgi:hypothetical protein